MESFLFDRNVFRSQKIRISIEKEILMNLFRLKCFGRNQEGLVERVVYAFVEHGIFKP